MQLSRVQVFTNLVPYQGVCGVKKNARCPNRMTKLAERVEQNPSITVHLARSGRVTSLFSFNNGYEKQGDNSLLYYAHYVI